MIGFIGTEKAAAFGRLCVETPVSRSYLSLSLQPPSGGCVLKLRRVSGNKKSPRQPPSGGCVLKPNSSQYYKGSITAAAFGRLCVETPRRLIWLNRGKSSRLRAAVC